MGKALLRFVMRSYSVYSVQSVVRRVLNHGLHGEHGMGKGAVALFGADLFRSLFCAFGALGGWKSLNHGLHGMHGVKMGILIVVSAA